MGEQWKPSALRAAGDIDRQAADDIEFGVTISTRDGRQLVREWHAALARAERAEAAANDCRRVIAAIPWRALASIYAHPGVVLDADADAIGEFLDQYADEWAGGFELRLIEEKQLERQAGDYARSLIAASAPSDFRRARGVIPWQPGDEPAETTIRRLRDAPERAELAEQEQMLLVRVDNALMANIINTGDKVVLLYLAVHADASGEYRVNKATLAQDLKRSQLSVYRSIRRLENAGLITRRLHSDGSRTGNIYTLRPSDNDLLSPDQEEL